MDRIQTACVLTDLMNWLVLLKVGFSGMHSAYAVVLTGMNIKQEGMIVI